MCGIIGCLSRSGGAPAGISSGLTLLRHRGPDDSGIWQDEHLKLGSTRLAILDLSVSGHQPMSYGEGRYWIVHNGEVYNYLELGKELEGLGHCFKSRTDTEVILAAFAQWGRDCLMKLRGMFAFAIWDTLTGELFLARDRMGEKPLYYWHDDKFFYFASELKALLALLPEKPALDPEAVDLYLHYQYVPEPKTPLCGVHKLAAAHSLSISLRDWAAAPRRYWDLEGIPPVSGDPAQLIRAEIERIITLTLRSDVPVGIALSGGIDSGALATLAASRYKDTLAAFTVGYRQSGVHDERAQARAFARSLGLPWYEIELSTDDFTGFFPDMVAAVDEPISDIAAFGHYAVNRMAAEHGIKVMLSGLGGDELFFGYRWVERSVQLTERKQGILRSSGVSSRKFSGNDKLMTNPLYLKLISRNRIPRFMQDIFFCAAADKLLDLRHPQQAVFYDLEPDFAESVGCLEDLYTSEFRDLIPNRNAYRPFVLDLLGLSSIPVAICKLLFDTWLVSNCLSLQDRVSMTSSVEARVPFLDYKLVELAIGLMKGPGRHKTKSKSLLKSALKGCLPDKVLKRGKRGFQPPIREWKTAVIQEYGHMLPRGQMVSQRIIDPDALLLYLNKKEANLHILFKILYFELWYRIVVLGRDAGRISIEKD